MHSFLVTYAAAFTDRCGVKWKASGECTVQAKTRAAAVNCVRSSWPAGAEGTCTAELAGVLERVRYNQAAGLPPSTFDESLPMDLLEAEACAYPI